jgi:DtxR family Mn-dependent transcriptional regulator
VRRHRLWETFLVDRLGFGWDEVHEVAEQLEHIASDKLIDKLDDLPRASALRPARRSDPGQATGGSTQRKTRRLDACRPG